MTRIGNDLGGSQSLSTQVFKKLEQAILTNELKTGDSLNELKISSQLGVSRTPGREALKQLEYEGLVKTVLNKGAVVVGISEKDIEDIYTIRGYLEQLAVRLAIKSLDLAALGRLREIVDLQEFYLGKGDLVKAHLLDSDFHAMLYEMSDSRPLTQTLTSFHNYIQRAREMSFQSRGRAEESIREHRAIVDAMERRDVPAAEKAVETHILNARHNLMATRAGKAAEGVE